MHPVFVHFIGLVFLAAVADAPPCRHPSVIPELKIGDWVDDDSKPPPGPGQPIGDEICELYCGIAVVDKKAWIPSCATYACSFRLDGPNGTSISRRIDFGPRFDGMTEPTSEGTLCVAWSEEWPSGWYRGTLKCDDSPSGAVTFDFLIDRSRPNGFEIPSSLWEGSNHCPPRPDFGGTRPE